MNLTKEKEKQKKIVISVILLAIMILSYTSIIDRIFQTAFLNNMEERGNRYYDGAIEKSVYTFAIVRGINGVISVIQGTRMDVAPAGVGVTIALGEILDPVNDLVERFSWVMLVSTTSLGIQKIIMEIGSWMGFRILLTLSMGMLLLHVWLNRHIRISLQSAGYKLLLASLVIRIGIPAVALFSERIYDLFLQKTYSESIDTLEKVNQEIRENEIFEDNENSGELSYLDKLKQFAESTAQALKIQDKIEFLKQKMSDYAKYTVNLMIVFVLQTILIPLIMLWALYRFAGILTAKPYKSPSASEQD